MYHLISILLCLHVSLGLFYINPFEMLSYHPLIIKNMSFQLYHVMILKYEFSLLCLVGLVGDNTVLLCLKIFHAFVFVVIINFTVLRYRSTFNKIVHRHLFYPP